MHMDTIRQDFQNDSKRICFWAHKSHLQTKWRSWCTESFNLLFWSLIPVQYYEEYRIFICSQVTTIKSSDRGESCKENFIKMDSQSK